MSKRKHPPDSSRPAKPVIEGTYTGGGYRAWMQFEDGTKTAVREFDSPVLAAVSLLTYFYKDPIHTMSDTALADALWLRRVGLGEGKASAYCAVCKGFFRVGAYGSGGPLWQGYLIGPCCWDKRQEFYDANEASKKAVEKKVGKKAYKKLKESLGLKPWE